MLLVATVGSQQKRLGTTALQICSANSTVPDNMVITNTHAQGVVEVTLDLFELSSKTVTIILQKSLAISTNFNFFVLLT